MKLLFSITASFLVTNLSNAQEVPPTNPDLRKIREEIISLIEQKQIPSMAIGVSKGDSILWQEALGYADIESKKTARTNSLYPLGSISKSITASLVMNLINNNKLKLTDNIQSLIEPVQLMDIDGKKPEIPIWQVLNMTAGPATDIQPLSGSNSLRPKTIRPNSCKVRPCSYLNPGRCMSTRITLTVC